MFAQSLAQLILSISVLLTQPTLYTEIPPQSEDPQSEDRRVVEPSQEMRITKDIQYAHRRRSDERRVGKG